VVRQEEPDVPTHVVVCSRRHRGRRDSKAVTMGGHLVTINDADEDTFVFDTFALHGGMSRSL
jgi:hypothetical protein